MAEKRNGVVLYIYSLGAFSSPRNATLSTGYFALDSTYRHYYSSCDFLRSTVHAHACQPASQYLRYSLSGTFNPCPWQFRLRQKKHMRK